MRRVCDQILLVSKFDLVLSQAQGAVLLLTNYHRERSHKWLQTKERLSAYGLLDFENYMYQEVGVIRFGFIRLLLNPALIYLAKLDCGSSSVPTSQHMSKLAHIIVSEW